MKTGRLRPFWPLSPTTAAHRLERSCLLAVAALVAALALGTAPTAAAPAGIAATRPEDPNVLVFQRRCIDRIIGQAVGQSEDAVVAAINRQCLMPRRGLPAAAAGLRLSCERPFPVRLRPATKRVAGCLGA